MDLLRAISSWSAFGAASCRACGVVFCACRSRMRPVDRRVNAAGESVGETLRGNSREIRAEGECRRSNGSAGTVTRPRPGCKSAGTSAQPFNPLGNRRVSLDEEIRVGERERVERSRPVGQKRSARVPLSLEMSRPSTSAARNLTLTEELEKLEQSITLTLQGALRARHVTD